MVSLPITRISKRCAFVGERGELDTVIFVHGLRGDHLDTWDLFPHLVKTDSELPDLNVMCWGYRTGLVKPFVLSTKTLGKNLATSMNTLLPRDARSYLVGHSMGGIVIFESLIGQFKGGWANQPPNVGVSQISLFASPVTGSNAAGIVREALRETRFLKYLLNGQVRSLARGENTDALLQEVHKRIYSPRRATSNARPIPIRMIVGSRDLAVSDEDKDAFKATFRRLIPMELDYGHQDLKLPDNHLDERYRAFANDLKDRLAESFCELCRRWVAGSADERIDIDIEFDRLYGFMVRDRFIAAGGDPASNVRLFLEYVEVIKRDGARSPNPCSYIAIRAVMVLRRRGLLPYV
jgi:pimeloyl-ACP methyl ester carboxylesterase